MRKSSVPAFATRRVLSGLNDAVRKRVIEGGMSVGAGSTLRSVVRSKTAPKSPPSQSSAAMRRPSRLMAWQATQRLGDPVGRMGGLGMKVSRPEPSPRMRRMFPPPRSQ